MRQPGPMEVTRPSTYEQAGPRHPRRRARAHRRLRRRHGRDARAYELSLRGLRRPARQVPRGARPPPPRRDRGRSTTAMLEAGAEVLETDSFQGSRLKLEEWGLGEHTVEINRKAAEIARKAAGADRFVAGSIGPTGFLPASDDPTLGDITFARLAEVFDEQAGALVEGGADLIIIETAQDILEVQGRDRRRPRGLQAGRPRGPDPGLGLAAAERRQDAARHRHPGGARDPRGHAGRHRRAQLLDRPRGHARRDPLPRRELAACRSTASRTPACRCRAPTARRSSRRRPSSSPQVLGEFVERHGVGIVGGCCGTTPEHIAALAERVGGHDPGRAPRARARRGWRR